MPILGLLRSHFNPTRRITMLNFKAVDKELSSEHPSAKMLVRALAQGQPKKMSKKCFEHSTDTMAAARHELVAYNPHTNVVGLTKKARKMLGE